MGKESPAEKSQDKCARSWQLATHRFAMREVPHFGGNGCKEFVSSRRAGSVYPEVAKYLLL